MKHLLIIFVLFFFSPAFAEVYDYSVKPNSLVVLPEVQPVEILWQVRQPIDLDYRIFELANGDKVMVFSASAPLTVVETISVNWEAKKLTQNTHRVKTTVTPIPPKPDPDPDPDPNPNPDPDPDPDPGKFGIGSAVYLEMVKQKCRKEYVESVIIAFNRASADAANNRKPLWKFGPNDENTQKGAILWELREQLAAYPEVATSFYAKFVECYKTDAFGVDKLHGAAIAFVEVAEAAKKYYTKVAGK